MLLSQQATLARLEPNRAVVAVAGNWMAMVQTRLPLLEKAVLTALGSPRQVVLEAARGQEGPTPAAAPTAPPPPQPAAQPQPPAAAPAPAPPAATASALPVASAEPELPPAPAAPAAAVAAAEPVAATRPPQHSPTAADWLDERAKRLADFFNGEVVQLDGPLMEEPPAADHAA